MMLEDTTVDRLGAQDIVKRVMDAFRPEDDEDDGWQFSNTYAEAAGTAFRGCRVLLSFSAKKAEKLDAFGQLQPGAFERAALLERYLLQHDDYRTLAQMYEWKTASEPLERAQAGAAGPCVTQKLLVRREFGNWELRTAKNTKI